MSIREITSSLILLALLIVAAIISENQFHFSTDVHEKGMFLIGYAIMISMAFTQKNVK